jgi:hypothetical protein
MKINLRILSLLFGALILLSACEEDERIYSDAGPTDATYAVFATGNYTFDFPKLDNNEQPSDGEFAVSVKLFGSPLDVDATVAFEVLDSSTAIVGSHFDFGSTGNTITVPAGSLTGTLAITAYNGFPYDDITGESVNGGMPIDSTLYLYLKTTTTGDISVYDTETVITVTLEEFNFCPWNVEDFTGVYTDVTEYGYYANYTTDIEIIAPEGQTGPNYEFTIKGLWNTGPGTIWGEVWTDGPVDTEVKIEATDKVFPVITIENQYLGITDGEWEYWIASYGSSEIMYCEKLLYLVYSIPYAGNEASLVDIVEIILDYDNKTAKTVVTPYIKYDLLEIYNK